MKKKISSDRMIDDSFDITKKVPPGNATNALHDSISEKDTLGVAKKLHLILQKRLRSA